jgi:hypothetical protein
LLMSFSSTSRAWGAATDLTSHPGKISWRRSDVQDRLLGSIGGSTRRLCEAVFPSPQIEEENKTSKPFLFNDDILNCMYYRMKCDDRCECWKRKLCDILYGGHSWKVLTKHFAAQCGEDCDDYHNPDDICTY